MGKTIRDESTASAYWAAVNTFCSLKDVHVIADAPVGCYNLVGVAVIDIPMPFPTLKILPRQALPKRKSPLQAVLRLSERQLKNCRRLDGN